MSDFGKLYSPEEWARREREIARLEELMQLEQQEVQIEEEGQK